MSTNIPQVQNTNHISDSEFVDLTVTFTNGTNQITRTLYFGNSFRVETINGNQYRDLGALMTVSQHQRDITSTGYDTTVGIIGIDDYYIYWVAGGPATTPIIVPGQLPIPVGYYPLLKGSRLRIFRGFYNDNYVLTGTYLRYTGIVTSYNITETRESDIEALNNTYTIGINCSSYRTVLENRIAGRKTNSNSWKYFNPNDTSMDRVFGLENKEFDFGKPVTGGTTSSSNSNTIDPNSGNQNPYYNDWSNFGP